MIILQENEDDTQRPLISLSKLCVEHKFDIFISTAEIITFSSKDTNRNNITIENEILEQVPHFIFTAIITYQQDKDV